ncbi:MAG: hypothetical protein R2708_05595 [Vicinamibacterales bacterium]
MQLPTLLVSAGLFLAALAAGAGPFGARPAEAASHPVVQATHPVLREALARIHGGSPSWRTALARLAPLGRQAVVLTPDQVVVKDAATGSTGRFDAASLAEVAPLADADGRVSTVMVVINVDGLEAAHARLGSLPGEFLADVDRVLAHEIYGHAVPYLEAGHVSGQCADPAPGTPVLAACAIQRENVIRAELRLGRRTDAGLGSLTLLRRATY